MKMEKIKNEIEQAFLDIQEEFPFGKEYMDGKLNKYIAIVSQIMKEKTRGSKILSIGSGPCDFEAILSKLGYNVTAIDDLNDQWHLIGKNKERIKDFANRLNIKLINQSAGSLKIKSNYFDVVLLIDIVEHLHNSPRELLNDSISSLEPDGLLIIETPNAVALIKRLKILFGKTNQISANFIYWNIGEYRSHVREYTQTELKQLFKYQNLISINSKMLNTMIDIVEVENAHLFKKITVKFYKSASNLYPNFRDTILISGKKPKNWHQTDVSIEKFKKYYSHLEKYNLDNEPDEVIISKIISF
jgi:2-polyprenyl-3-methyl-5-hydroxy-6-metoxy-1,4-benzoquinol methylase